MVQLELQFPGELPPLKRALVSALSKLNGTLTSDFGSEREQIKQALTATENVKNALNNLLWSLGVEHPAQPVYITKAER